MLKVNEVAMRLKAARDLIADKSNWTQGTYSKVSKAEWHISAKFPFVRYIRQYQYCAMGAVVAVFGGNELADIDNNKAMQLLNETASKLFFFESIIALNDGLYLSPDGKTIRERGGHADVIKCFDKAIEKAEEMYFT